MTYAEKLQDPRWQKKRLEILQRDNFRCTCCGDDKATLHVHHVKYKGEPWEVDNSLLRTLCNVCHFAHEFYKDTIIRKIVKTKFPSGDIWLIFSDNWTIVSFVQNKEIIDNVALSAETIEILFNESRKFITNG